MKSVYGWAFPDADQFMSSEIKPDGTYQGSHFQIALKYVKDFTLAIDGGAHVGTWSRLMAAQFERVIAVEPSADTFEALEANLKAFNLINVDARQIAIGKATGKVTMVLDGRAATLKNTGARYVQKGGEIRCEAVDDWHLPSLGFLKLDVEGSEVAALEGASETLQRCKPVVLYESKLLWKRYGHKSNAPQLLLTKLGFKHLADAGCDQVWGPA